MSLRAGLFLGSVGLAILPASLAQAQTTATAVADEAAGDAGGAGAAGGGSHTPAPADIIVTGSLARNRADILSGTTVIQGAELTRQIRSTIGETLARQAGVSSTAFGPNASRPVLRGFQGERIRVLTDGIGSFDVSNTSVDHAVVVNPQLAERIEVLRGPASLLYGSSAIGGVVNVIDTRIPRAVPDEAAHVDLSGTYASAANERDGGAVVDVPLTSKVVAHFDGSYAKSSDLEIGGFLLSRSARATALASRNPDAVALANQSGTLPNSAARTYQFAGGLALIDDNGSGGFAVSHYDSVYGVPARYDLATGDGELVHLHVRQTRVDARAGLELGDGLLEKLTARYGYADYKHEELSDQNVVNTTFLNKSMEGRLEVSQAKRGVWQGASGIQFLFRDFDIVGAEAFVPRNATNQFGVFTLQTFDFGAFKAEASGRYEHSAVQTRLPSFRGAPNAFDRRFDAFSGSVGGSATVARGVKLGLNLSHTERAPSAEELLANGPHGGTQAFEVGDRGFGKETANGAEAVLRTSGPGYSFEASVYYTRFAHYIFEDQTGAVDAASGLPVFQNRAGRARYYGAEAQGTLTLAKFGDATLNADALADYVDARLLGGLGPVPRIPPFRALGGVALTNDRGEARVEAEYSARQAKVAAFETPTDSYTLVNVSVSYKPFIDRPALSVVVSANNLFDVDARRHASFLKDFAALPGRDVRVSLRATY